MRKGQIITSKMIKDANTINLRTILLQVDVVLFCLPWSRWMWSANVIFVNREDPQINCRLFNFLYDARLWMTGRQNCQIFGFWSIFPIQNDKKYPAVTSLQPGGYIAEWFWFFHVVVKGPKGCLPGSEFSYDFWWGSRGPPNLPKFVPTANGYTLTECYYTERLIWTKDVWKRAILRTDVLSVGWRMFPCIFRDSQEIWTHEFVSYCPLRVHVRVHYWKSRD